MAIKIVYVNPNDMLDIRIITDPDAPKNNKEWEYQIRPAKILVTVAGANHIKLLAGMTIVEETSACGTTLRYR